jgi:hypothetical protein
MDEAQFAGVVLFLARSLPDGACIRSDGSESGSRKPKFPQGVIHPYRYHAGGHQGNSNARVSVTVPSAATKSNSRLALIDQFALKLRCDSFGDGDFQVPGAFHNAFVLQ